MNTKVWCSTCRIKTTKSHHHTCASTSASSTKFSRCFRNVKCVFFRWSRGSAFLVKPQKIIYHHIDMRTSGCIVSPQKWTSSGTLTWRYQSHTPYQPPAVSPQHIDTMHMIHRAVHAPRTFVSLPAACKPWERPQLHPPKQHESQKTPEK